MGNTRTSRALLNRLESFCMQKHVEMLYIFGSRAVEIRKLLDTDSEIEPGKSSDVDIAVKLSGNRTLSVREKAELSVAFENFFGVDRADVILLPEADPFLAVNIIRGERVFCADAYQADEYELYVLRRAGDLAPFERLRIERIMDSSERGPIE